MPIGKGAHKAENMGGQGSLDGQGGAEQISQTKSEHRNIYYRLYTKEGPIESNNPIFCNDRSISRISSKSVRPPHTVASLKRFVCKIEGMEGPEKGALYLSLSERKPLDDSARLELRGNSGPGSSEVHPVIFVVDKGAAEERPKSASNAGSNELPAWNAEKRYVYYRLYDDDGEAVSKTSFDDSDSCLGRIDISTIPPPRTVASLKDCLVHVEGVPGHDVQLLENEDGEVALNDGDAIALLTNNFPGSKKGQPIAFTYVRNASYKTMAPAESPLLSRQLTTTSYWAPATEAPATEAPATEAPATEAPATEAPATEAPATEAPATEAPAATWEAREEKKDEKEEAKVAAKSAKVSRRLAARVGELFKVKAKTGVATAAKVDERPPKIDEPAPVAPLEQPFEEPVTEVAPTTFPVIAASGVSCILR